MSKFILRNASQVNQSKSVSQSQGVYAMINSKTRDCSTYCTNAKYITAQSAIIRGMRPFSLTKYLFSAINRLSSTPHSTS